VAELINLNKARKAKAKAAAKAQSAGNRMQFGRTKGEKAASKLEAERARKDLEGKKRED
jgi:uncharacterized protein DUF4169